MGLRFYTTGQLAKLANVSVRALRFYDQAGLLVPSQHSEAGYRLYAEEDLARLQQILALKFLGFSLEEIRVCLDHGPRRLTEALAQQKAMLRDKRAHLDAILRAIERTERLLADNRCTWESIVQLTEVIQVEQNRDWVDKYFTPEQRQKMQELMEKSYSAEAKRQLAPRQQAWTEADQERASARWDWVNAELKRLIAAGADPAGPEAQAWARTRSELLSEFTQGSPEIEAGLKQWWKNYWSLPPDQRPMNIQAPSEEEEKFTREAMASLRKT
jgi:DNA-binding transcriptional MerR regulator